MKEQPTEVNELANEDLQDLAVVAEQVDETKGGIGRNEIEIMSWNFGATNPSR